MKKLSRRTLLRTGLASGLASGVASGLALTGGYGYTVAHNLETVRLDIPIHQLDRSLNGFKIGVLSDFHAGAFLSPEDISEAVSAINSLQPDIVALLGDFVDCRAAAPGNNGFLFETLGRLKTTRGVFAVLGNHDNCQNPFLIRSELRRQSIVVLDNAHRRVAAGLLLAGIDDYREGQPDLPRAMKGVEAGGVVILLSHNPDINQDVADERIKLVLSGHTHGGQVRIPFVNGAPWVPCSARYHGLGGLIKEGPHRWTFITKGIGTCLLPVRIACPPDVGILTLRRP